jgi:hypothetical protein
LFELEQAKIVKESKYRDIEYAWDEYKQQLLGLCRQLEQTTLKSLSELGAQRKVNLRVADAQETAQKAIHDLQGQLRHLN